MNSRHGGIKASRHQGIKASRHQGIKASRHQGIKASRHQGIKASLTYRQGLVAAREDKTVDNYNCEADLPHPALGQDVTPSLSRATPSAASEHLSELIGFPISMSIATCCVCLELRSLSSTGITRLQRYYEPLRHPKAPGLSLTGFRLVLADHAMGLPVLRALSLCTCCRHYPGAASGRTASLTSPSRISLPRKGRRVGLRIVLFEACSAFTRATACTLAPSPIRDALSEGLSYFVTSIAAPVASGWSVAGWGLHPLESAALSRRTPIS
jgi:hypothetical protein